MIRLLLIFLCLSSSLFAIRYEGDRQASSYELRKQNRRIDTFDFTGEYPFLENIDIDARRNKKVELVLTGEYPILETINYEGTFGALKGKLTGNFPNLSLVNFLCTSCAMDLDLSAGWQRSCEINIVGMKEDIILNLPQDVGIQIKTKTGARGKVIAAEGLKKEGWFGILKKTYKNALFDTSDVVLIINVETTDGRIILKTPV